MANDKGKFQELISRVLKYKIFVNPPFVSPYKRYIEPKVTENRVRKKMFPYQSHWIDWFSELHRWTPANPSKPNIVARLNTLYCEIAAKVNNDENAAHLYANHCINDDKEKILEHSERRFRIEDVLTDQMGVSLLVGIKGSGKTTFLNYWLNNRSNYLNKQGWIWLRSDCAKLHEFGNDSQERIKLSTYHKAHSCYVILKYGSIGSDALLRKIYTNIIKATDGDLFLKEAISDFERATKAAQEAYEVIHPDDVISDASTHYFFYELLKLQNWKASTDRIYQMFDTIRIKEKIKLLVIIDGLDNITWKLPNPYYNDLIREAAQFTCPRPQRAIGFNSCIIAMRHNTIPDFISETNNQQQSISDGDEPSKLFVKGADAQSVLTHKSTIATNADETDLRKRKDEFDSKFARLCKEADIDNCEAIAREECESFYEFSKDYLTHIRSTVQRCYCRLSSLEMGEYKIGIDRHEIKTDNDIVKILFDSNIRAVVDNCLSVYSMKKWAAAVGILGAENNDRLLQYLLLNGELYPHTQKYATIDKSRVGVATEKAVVRRHRGYTFPNLFWWYDRKSIVPSKWHGLAATRLIQYVFFFGTCSVNEVVPRLEILFDYSKVVLEEVLSILIDSNLFDIVDGGYLDEHNWDYRITLTKKGLFLKDFCFVHPDWLYFCAIEVPMPRSVTENSKEVQVYRDDSGTLLNSYNVSLCKTLPTFCRILKEAHATEMVLLKEQYKNNAVKLNSFSDENKLLDTEPNALEREVFCLPPFLDDIIKDRLGKAFDSVETHSEYGEQTELIRDLKGITQPE